MGIENLLYHEFSQVPIRQNRYVSILNNFRNRIILEIKVKSPNCIIYTIKNI